MKTDFLIFMFPWLFFFISCNNSNLSESDCVCTMEFRTISVLVLDQNNQPVANANTSSKIISTGEIFIENGNYFLPGNYIVADDLITKKLNYSEALLFTVKKDSVTNSTQYIISTDQCKCHVSKSSGPDTLFMKLN